MGRCNFCSLRAIRQIAHKNKAKVVMRQDSGPLGGVNVYTVPQGIVVPEEIKPCTSETTGNAFHIKYFSSWFMGLSDHCVC